MKTHQISFHSEVSSSVLRVWLRQCFSRSVCPLCRWQHFIRIVDSLVSVQAAWLSQFFGQWRYLVAVAQTRTETWRFHCSLFSRCWRNGHSIDVWIFWSSSLSCCWVFKSSLSRVVVLAHCLFFYLVSVLLFCVNICWALLFGILVVITKCFSLYQS